MDLPAAPYQLRIETATATVVDAVTYDATWISSTTGQSTYLCTNHLSAVENDDATNWAIDSSSPQYGTGNIGTPAAGNLSACSPP